jgi:hypothetical protein
LPPRELRLVAFEQPELPGHGGQINNSKEACYPFPAWHQTSASRGDAFHVAVNYSGDGIYYKVGGSLGAEQAE